MTIHEIRVFEEFDDPRADALTRQALQQGIDAVVETSRVFYLEGVTPEQANFLGKNLLSDLASQRYEAADRQDWDNDHVVEVAPLPASTSPERESIEYGAKLLNVPLLAAESGVEYRFHPSTPREVVDTVVNNLLVNTNVEQVRTAKPDSLRPEGQAGPIRTIPTRELDDEALMALSKSRKLALSIQEMRAIREKAWQEGRELRDGEIEYLAGAWSDHCCHKTTNALIEHEGKYKPSIFKRIKEASYPYFEERGVLSAFDDNSGVFAFYEHMAINIKLETHNSPRNVEPRGGAATGTGGVLRDINATGLGARPINSMHMDFIAPPDISQEEIPPGTLTPIQLITGSVQGVGGYGNPMGVPTNNGSFHTHRNYRGKSSILVGSMGIMEEQNSHPALIEAGDLVVAVGGRTGRDGIHGATFSSESASAETAVLHSGAVQIGAPITQKKMFDAILEASRQGLILAMTDCGAAGFASAIGELGEQIGVTVDLGKAPLKYQGLEAWEKFLSESQERAVLAIDPEHIEAVQAIFAKHQSEATVLGEFGTGSEPRLEVRHNGEMLIDLDYEFIKNGRGKEVWTADWTPPDIQERPPVPADWQEAMTNVLSDWNVCSKEPIIRRYDHEVQGTSALKPYGGVHGDAPNNAAIMTPLLGKEYAVIQAHGCNPALTELDPSRGSVWSYVEAMSNFVASGGNPDNAIIVNNYISASPTERVIGALDKSVDALVKCVHEFHSPIISGKDSLSSTYTYDDGTKLESPYNLIITVAGKVPSVAKTLSTDIKQPGSTLVFVGKPDYAAMGGSVYYEQFSGQSATVPNIDLQNFHATCRAVYRGAQKGAIMAAHDVSEGGLAVTISEMLFGGDCGADLALDIEGVPAHQAFFNETAGGFVVEVADEQIAKTLFGHLPHRVLGRTNDSGQLSVRYNDTALPVIAVQDLKSSWKQPLEEVFA